ncbi:unnamed protein product [Paramecium primaurelia]|uniref:Cilia- and flagella-associated protein 58 central coiled coil domain-containing protein n=1 Tax=Paramecium primaurelia TaxID=5886 RepID=A0A8S1K108_PARPR|nr:unnamed protein product [Paramecium primaurelia]
MARAPEEGLSLAALNKEIDQYSTDPQFIQQIEKHFQDVVRDFSGDPDLELFKIKYETLYNSLKESYENEVRWTKKCKEHNGEIVIYTSKVQMSLKMINDDNQQSETFQKELEEKWRKIEDLKIKEKELKERIVQAKIEVENLKKQCDRVVEDIEEQSQIQLNDKKRLIDEIKKNFQSAKSKFEYLEQQNKNLKHDLDNEEKQYQDQIQKISDLEDKIAKIDADSKEQEKRKKKKEVKMADIKQKIDQAKKEIEEKQSRIHDIKKQIVSTNNTILIKIKEKESQHTKQKEAEDKFAAALKDRENQEEQLKSYKEQIKIQQEQLEKLQIEIQKEKKEVKKTHKEQEITAKEKNKTIKEKEEQLIEKNTKDMLIETEKIELQQKKDILDKINEQNSQRIKSRTQQQKTLKKQEDVQHQTDEEIVNKVNKLKKVENQVMGYEASNERINKMILQLQREQEKYGIEASQAHAKFYQTVEEVKIKNNQIAEQQKQIAEAEARLKHQQQLYETVRSDRNLYSKNLLESHNEIQELTKKYTRMKHQVDQLKEEIKTKDQQLVKEDLEFHKVEEENAKIEQDKAKVEKNIKADEDLIKNQESHISRLKNIIQGAQTEKQRQQKDYEMVVNERDILGTQLIKRNQELQVLYEKIKLNQSSLSKGEINFREREIELKSLKDELTNLRNELKSTQDQTACIDELRKEINNIEKELLNEKNKVKALSDELENPMNVHRWRKLEATDQENFERILKIQTLQRRLIAKTEEVNEKENLIKEKEKLFMELKNILSRQPGVEIHQQLAQYKESLKENAAKMKTTLSQLKQSQDYVDMLKFEIDRMKGDLQEMKKTYFQMRKEKDNDLLQDDQNGEQGMPQYNGGANQNDLQSYALFGVNANRIGN